MPPGPPTGPASRAAVGLSRELVTTGLPRGRAATRGWVPPLDAADAAGTADGHPAFRRWHRTVLLGLIAVGLVAGLPDLVRRAAAEQANRTVELVADQQTFAELAWQSGMQPQELLAQLHAVGVTGLGVPEDSLDTLDEWGLVSEVSGSGWLANLRSAGRPLPAFPVLPNGTYALLAPSQAALADFVARGLEAATGLAVQRGLYAGQLVVGVDLPPSVAGSLPLGFRPPSGADPGAFGLARALGLDVVPRPQGTPRGYTAEQVQALFAQVRGAGVPVHSVLFAGASTLPVPGYPSALGATAQALRIAGWNLAVLETPKQLSNVDQPGTRQLSDLLGQRTVRVYSVPPWLLQQYTEPEAVTALVTSVQERNLRILYLHPIPTGADRAARTVRLYADVAELLHARGFQLGPPQPFPDWSVPAWQRVLQSLAVVAAWLWLLEVLFPGLEAWGWWPLGVLGGLAVLTAAASHTLSVTLASLGAAAAFGGLAALYVAGLWHRPRWGPAAPGLGRVWLRALGAAIVQAAIAFAGALLVASLLGDTRHMLEWTYFRGVKVTYVAIPFLALCGFAAVVGFRPQDEATERGGLVPEVRWLIAQPVRYGHVAVLLLVALVGAVYLIRSGNVSAALVPAVETRLRDWLALHLVARPREKEFLAGYPGLFLAVLAARHRWRWAFLLFVLGASVASVSLVDSFEHIRTPLLYSIQREAGGLLVGLLTGTAALLLVAVGVRLAGRRQGTGPA
jgi:hypothetical protein